MPDTAEYGLLGPLTVRRAGADVQVPPGKQQVLLAALLLRGGRAAGIDELAEALWGEQPPQTARVSVQNYVGRLRQVLGPGGDAAIVTEPGGYRIAIGPGELDADRFEAALAAGRAAARAGDWARAAGALREGLALWRGEPLAGIDSQILLSRDGARLAELRWQAAEALADADLQLGRHSEVIAGLRQAAVVQPLRERLHGLLMLALYRDGQQAAALAAYQAARTVLAAELGAEPGPEMQGLQRQILRADPALAAPEQARSQGLEARYALPPDTAAFTGREAELAAITAAVTDAAAGEGGVAAIRAIGGMPGVGKTALAVHAAHRLAARFPDRQLLVSMHGHTPGQDPVTPADALAGLLASTGLDPRALPGDLEGRAALWRHRMAGQKALLVLDNAASSAQVTPLLPGSAGCLVLVTSRRHLGDLPGALQVVLEALPPGEAAEMFLRLAPRANAAPQGAVAELARLAGFLPLAISLLARVCSRHPSWTPADLAAETRASLLTLTAEHDSIAAAFDISYRYLPPARQRFFRSLGLHPGTTTDAYTAAALAGIPLEEAAAHLDGLHAEGLLTETAYRRYGMHDLIRRYARDHAAADPVHDARRAVGRLLDYYQLAAARAEASLARQTRPGPPPASPPGLPVTPDLDDETRALAWARAEHATLLACLDHAAATGQHARVIALTADLAGLLRRDGHWAEAITRHAAAAQAAQRLGDRPGQASALSSLGDIRLLTGDCPAAAQVLEQALGIYRDLGDRPGQASALCDLGSVRWRTGDYPAAARMLEQALGAYRDLGDRHGHAYALNELGLTRLQTGDFPAAARDLEQALGIYRDLGSRHGQATVLHNLGAVRLQAGDFPAAARDLEQALGIYRDLRSRHGQAYAVGFLGGVRRLTGDFPAAARALEQALGIFRDLGNRAGEALALNERGALYRNAGDPGRAEGCHRQALDLARAIAGSRDEAHALAGLGRCASAAGHAARAEALLWRALQIFQRIGAAEACGLSAELDALAGPPPVQ